ncbi:MAG: MFS transporter [Pseudomonadales bacterium]
MTTHAPAVFQQRKFFYGWVIVIGGYFVGLLTSGLLSYTRGIFLVPMAAELGASRLELSLGFTITSAVAALTAPLAGYLLDRFPVPRLMTVMAIWTALGYFALSAVGDKLALFLVLGLFFGLATFHLGGPAPSKLVVGWFDTRRGLALSLLAMGASTAGVLTPPIATALIETFGWRWAFVAYGTITLVAVLPLTLLLLRDPPRPTPQVTADLDDAESLHGGAAAQPLTTNRVWKRREYLSSPSFWGIVTIFGVMGCIFSGVSLHLFAHITDIGIDPLRASLVLSVMAGLALVSKPVFGWLVDKLDPRVSVMVSLLTQLLGVGLLLFAGSFLPVLLAAAAFGFGFGGMVPLRNALTAIGFGALSFGEVGGAMRTAMAPLTLGGMPLAGWIYDAFGSYNAAFVSFVCLYALALLAVLLLRLQPPQQPAGS